MKYKWVDGSHIKIDAEIAAKELERIRKVHGGKLKREFVVESARNKSSPLHDHFEWNNTIAAENYRLQQAGYMIRSISVVFENPESEEELNIRTYVSVKTDDEDKPIFTTLQLALQDDNMRTQVFQRALKEINIWKQKYKYLTVFANIFAKIDELNEANKINTIRKVVAKR